MELVVKVPVQQIEKYKNANAFLFGLENFSYVQPFNITLKQLKEIKNKLSNKKIFVAIDKNIFNKDIKELEEILLEIEKIHIDGIMFYDLAIINLAKKLNLTTPLIWSQDFLVTNYETCNYYHHEGVQGAVLSSILTTEEILTIANHTKMDLFVNIFGYQVIAFSKRKLISNYLEHFDIKNNNEYHHITEKDKKYAIKENEEGTKILSDEVLNGILEIKKLKNTNSKYLILSSEDINKNDFKQIINIFSEALETEDLEPLNKKIQALISNTSDIFLNQKTIYKVKK